MLQSYQAIYDHLTWLTDKPSVENAHDIVTLLSAEEVPVLKEKRPSSLRISRQGKIPGDILAPAVPIGCDSN